jgi:hypothetical protein
MQYDFRSIYATILEKWFCLEKNVVDSLFPPNVNTTLQSLPLLKAGACTGITPPPVTGGNATISNYPNPFTRSTTIKFSTDGGYTLIQVFDTLGRLMSVPVDTNYPVAGIYTVTLDTDSFAPGVYYARLQNGVHQYVRAMMKVKS